MEILMKPIIIDGQLNVLKKIISDVSNNYSQTSMHGGSIGAIPINNEINLSFLLIILFVIIALLCNYIGFSFINDVGSSNGFKIE